MANRLPKSFHCSTEFTLAVLGGKWKTVILCHLKQRSCRYSDLRRLMPMVSDKVLTERLHDLVLSGLVAHRKSGKDPSSAIYTLGEKGRSLSDVLHTLFRWGHENAAKFHVEVGEPPATRGWSESQRPPRPLLKNPKSL